MPAGITDFFLFAQQPAKGEPQVNLVSMLIPFLLIGLVFYFMLIRPQKREQARRDQLLSALKKNDRVVTVGGIIGTIASLSPDGKEATLKVDDNTRIRILRSHIQGVLSADSPEEGTSSAS